MEEGTQTCQEGDCGVVLIEGGDGVRVGPLQILNIGGQIIAREIIHAFVKAAVIGVFDAVGVGIIPDNVASGASGEMAEVDAGNGISFVFDFALEATGFDRRDNQRCGGERGQSSCHGVEQRWLCQFRTEGGRHS